MVGSRIDPEGWSKAFVDHLRGPVSLQTAVGTDNSLQDLHQLGVRLQQVVKIHVSPEFEVVFHHDSEFGPTASCLWVVVISGESLCDERLELRAICVGSLELSSKLEVFRQRRLDAEIGLETTCVMGFEETIECGEEVVEERHCRDGSRLDALLVTWTCGVVDRMC